MNEKDVIREAIKARGINQTMLAKMAGLKRQSNVAEMLRSQSLSVKNFVMLLDAMGFDVEVRDRNSMNKENRWILGGDEE